MFIDGIPLWSVTSQLPICLTLLGSEQSHAYFTYSIVRFSIYILVGVWRVSLQTSLKRNFVHFFFKGPRGSRQLLGPSLIFRLDSLTCIQSYIYIYIYIYMLVMMWLDTSYIYAYDDITITITSIRIMMIIIM